MFGTGEARLHPRFALEQKLGEGGFGVVYAAFDEERHERVALKLLRRMSASSLQRFKREFRALQQLTHPNLPLLYELFCSDEQWFFTMELIAGTTLSSYVTGEHTTEEIRPSPPTATLSSAGEVLALARASTTPHAKPTYDERRLRHALDQLVDVVAFIHRRGFVHGDIKPSNVIVGNDERVYLLDFGLVGHHAELRHEFAGTTAYAAPELRSGGTIDRGHDAYSLGSMFFELLTGRLPFSGGGLQALIDKSVQPAPPVTSVVPDAPSDLAERIDGWLARRPEARAPIEHDANPRPSAPARRFVGRSAELARLHAALQRAASRRRLEVVSIEGKSGFGKSALIEAFLAEAAADALVLSSRASPKEHLPFNALDGLLDELGPLGVPSHAPRVEVAAALKEAIRAQSGGRPIVLWLDDVHWADADSVAVVEELVQPPRLRSCLLLLSRRPHEMGYTAMPLPCPVEQLTLGPLDARDATRLARLHGLGHEHVSAVVERAAGMPLFLEALCSSDARDYADAPSLIADRAQRLPPLERTLLDVLALSQSTLLPHSLVALVRERDGTVGRSLETLCRQRLLRPVRVRDVDTYAPFHDQVRETVVGLMSPDEVRRYHQQILTILDASDPRHMAARFEHLRGAGHHAEAAALAIEAAQAAAAQSAYEQAALHLEQALALGALDDARREALLEELVLLYERGKLGPRAAQAAVALAAATRDPEKRLNATIRAVRHFMACGEIERGRALMAETFVAAGEVWPQSEIGTVARLFAERTLGFYDARSVDPTDAASTARYRLLSGVADGLALIDPSRSFLFVSRTVARARAAQRPEWLALQLLREAVYTGSLGSTGRIAARRNVDKARALYPEGSAEIRAWELLVIANMDLHANPTRATGEALRRASEAFAALPDSDGLWASNCGLIRGTCLRVIGDLPALRQLADWLAREAEHRNDTALRTTTRFGGAAVWLADDAPEVSRHLLSSVPWPPRLDAFHFQHWLRAETEIETSLYEGDGEAGWQRVGEARRGLLLSSPKALQTVRMSCNFSFGRGLLGAMEAEAERNERLRRRDRLLLRTVIAWLENDASRAALLRGSLLRAGLAHVEGDASAAVDELWRARAIADNAGYAMDTALVTLTLAALGAPVRDRLAEAERTLAELGVVAPTRFVAVQLPGFRRRFSS